MRDGLGKVGEKTEPDADFFLECTQGGTAAAQGGRRQKDQETAGSVPRAAVSPPAGLRRLPEGQLQSISSL